MSLETRLRKLETASTGPDGPPPTYLDLVIAVGRVEAAEQAGQPPAPADQAVCDRFCAAYPDLLAAALAPAPAGGEGGLS